ncbi:TlpA family protein disulfide reductase [Pedobacter soli]|uniref:Thiol-disulfide isomerase or thioredoxin n=1 Tax=Pedobacter soli TaxID=390242 RepID=A0A1G6WX70_9SPHI|nr:TlpA disulfide reductase family protein [Pedobacter soli]SDD69605.1 Thiol-disulfide isomerase or thioredoxin [Pedobacter soli]
MKYITSLFLLFAFSAAKSQTINKPYIEFTNTGIYHIDKITVKDTSTIVDIKISFLPNWWTMFSNEAYLENADTGEKYIVKVIEGAKFNTKLWTPKSGDTSVRLIFPKLDKNVKHLNYGDEGKTSIYGISLQKEAKTNKPTSIPENVSNWLNLQITDKRRKIDQNIFFVSDSVKIVGYIKGYDKRAGFSSGIIYHQNHLTREDFPTTVRIYEDGRFECSMLATHAISSSIFFNNQVIDFYAKPGTVTGIILDWDEFLLADKYRDRRYGFENLQYLGVNKSVNETLNSIKVTLPDYGKLAEYREKQKPEEFKDLQVQHWEKARKAVDSIISKKRIPENIKRMIVNQVDLAYANYLFDYENSRGYYKKEKPENEILKLPMPGNYFDFLDRIDLNDKSLLISSQFSTFINRFEFSPLYERRLIYNSSNGYLKLDSAYLAKNKKSNLVFDIAKIRSLISNFKFSQYKSKDFIGETTYLSQSIKEPFAVSEMNRMYNKYKKGNVAYELPNNVAAEVFRKIINPLKGKILIVDFWAQWCGPCRSGIEESLELRKKYKGNPDFDFVFVTDAESTESAFYDDYISKNAMINTYRIKADEYLALRELFKFNGIPRYILVNGEGKIQDDNFSSYNLKNELNKYFPGKFTDSYWK